MFNYYFTFGSDPQFPFQGGYLIITAKDMDTACDVFNALYPNPKNKNVLNCAFFYTEEKFDRLCAKYYGFEDFHGVIDTTLKTL